MNTIGESVVKTFNAESASDLLDAIHPQIAGSRNAIYRGHSDSKYQLVPTALREGSSADLRNLDSTMWTEAALELPFSKHSYQAMSEYQVLRSFYNAANMQGLPVVDDSDYLGSGPISPRFPPSGSFEDWPPKAILPTLALAQHYGLPTRLLDWSFNHLVALYFAASGACKKIQHSLEGNGPQPLSEFDDRSLAVWRIHEWVSSPDLAKKLEVVWPPSYMNPNLALQKGVLTLWRTDESDEDPPDRRSLDVLFAEEGPITPDSKSRSAIKTMKLFTAPWSTAPELLGILRAYGICAATLHAGYSGVAKGLVEDAMLNKLLMAYPETSAAVRERRSDGSQ